MSSDVVLPPVYAILSAGHKQSAKGTTTQPADPAFPEKDAGINGVMKRMVAYDFPMSRIFITSEDGPSHDIATTRASGELIRILSLSGGRNIRLGMIGYSHGGGLIYELSSEAKEYADDTSHNSSYTLQMTGYTDAIKRRPVLPAIDLTAEDRRPVASLFHDNFCESQYDFSQLPWEQVHGTLTDDSRSGEINQDMDDPDNLYTHSSIDKDPLIHEVLAMALVGHVMP